MSTDRAKPVPPGPYYSPEVAAEMLHLAPKTLANWRSRRNSGENIGPEFVRLARRILYPKTCIEAFLSSQASVV